MKITEMNWMQVEAYLKGDDRAVVPIGSTEQHGQLSLGIDLILSERVSVEAAAIYRCSQAAGSTSGGQGW